MAVKVKLHTVFDPPGHPGLSFEGDPGLTEQGHKEACDINFILARYERTGQLPHMIRQNPVYGDFSSVPEYQQALGVVMFAQEQFDALDAKLRSKFENDPAKFLEFASDPKNRGEMRKMGLLKPEGDATLRDVVEAVRSSKSPSPAGAAPQGPAGRAGEGSPPSGGESRS